MDKELSRRDFFTLLGILPFAYIQAQKGNRGSMFAAGTQPDILIIVFDAFCSQNMPLFGYARDTTPNLNALAESATVYHSHYAAGNFTTPGTASLLTGTYPWTHRAIQINSSVDPSYQSRHIYRLFADYHTFTYSHNQLVTLLQNQFLVDINRFKPREDLTLGENKWLSRVFHKDEDIATVSWARATGKAEDGLSTSLFLPTFFEFLSERRNQRMADQFPLGLPISSLDHFLLEDAVDWLMSVVKTLPQPFLGYCHFLPPHAPYNTRREFTDRFLHTAIPNPSKPKHPLAKPGRVKQEHGLDHYRRIYDEYILYVDAEFNRLFQTLKQTGILENAYLILTSDHGEMFERGIMGHSTPSLHEPVVRIPLLIFEPGQKKRVDVYDPTNAVDLLPTLLHLTGRPIPAWIEGNVLPPYQPADPEHSIFALEAKTNQPSKPLRSASALIRKGTYKLTKYFGYGFLQNSDTLVELYDLHNDPEEMNDLSETKPETTRELLKELETKIQTADESYQ